MGLDANRITGSKIYSRRPSKYSLYGSATVRVCQRMRTCVTKCVVSSVPGGTRYGIQSVRTQCTGLKSQLTHAIYITIL